MLRTDGRLAPHCTWNHVDRTASGVVQTIGTARWKWSIEIEPGRRRRRTGRLLAIRRAERAIEEAIKVKRTKSPPTQ